LGEKEPDHQARGARPASGTKNGLNPYSARNSLTRVKGVAAADYLVRSSSQGERACWAYLYAMC
jgi:hypothetical protein